MLIIRKTLFYFIVCLFCLFAAFPFIWMISISLKSPNEIYSNAQTLIPKELNWNGYKEIFNIKADANVNFINWFKNSTLISLYTTFLSLFISTLGAYALSRFRFRGRSSVAYTILITQMIPASLLLIPLYLIMKDFNLLNSHFGLVLAYTTFAIPFCTWMLKGYFDTIPQSIDEAARIDGASNFKVFWKVVLPLTVPGLVVTGIFSFITSWNEFLFAYVFLNDYEAWTLSVGIASFRGQYTVNWDYLMAGSVFATIPIIIIFWVLQKHLVSGMTGGAVK